jgi:two-component system, OmpR family, copper resistance phosphate regulon response regulator CusR
MVSYRHLELMQTHNRRSAVNDRRRIPRGGRRATDQPGRHPHVLVADSYDGARIPFVKYLDRMGFGVIEAGNGQGALAHIDAQTADVIVIENGLPDAPVAWIVDRLRGASQAVPLIVMTSDLDVVEERVAGLPLVAVLEKPFSLTTMLAEIRRLLRAPQIAVETTV